MSFPVGSSEAERVYFTLKAAHLQFVVGAESEADLPAWYVLTAAGAIRIRTVGTFQTFVRFGTADGQVLLIAPEAVAVTMRKLAPESDEPRFRIGFASPSSEDAQLAGEAGSDASE